MAEEKKDIKENVEADPTDDPARSGLIAQILAMMKKFTVGQDLTAQPMAMPEGFEGKDSGLERMQTATLQHSNILIKVNDIDDPVLRLVQILKWLFTFGQMFLVQGYKKPLNPVLGEVSVCKVNSNLKEEKEEKEEGAKDTTNDAFYGLSEMVSHHPPISAYTVENQARGIKLEGCSKANIKFTGTAIRVVFEGGALLTVNKFNEVYEYCPPPLMVKLVGFVLEYSGKMEVACKSHPYVARITFKEKPLLRGKYHRVKGTIVKVNKEKEKDEEIVVKFKGHWNDEIKFEDLRNNQVYTFAVASEPKPLSLIHPSFDNELPESSRKIWYGVKNAPNSAESAKAKRTVEEAQRKKAKEREETKTTHVPQFFEPHPAEGFTFWKPKSDAIKSIVF